MKHWLLFLLLGGTLVAKAQQNAYLFSYFVKNGEDGLHFAYSTDGLHWKALKGGNPFLKPTVGKDIVDGRAGG